MRTKRNFCLKDAKVSSITFRTKEKQKKKHVSKIQYNHFRNNKQYEIIYKT